MRFQPTLLHCASRSINFCVPVTTSYATVLVLQQINPSILLGSENRNVYLSGMWLDLFSLGETLHHNLSYFVINFLTLLIISDFV